MRQAITTLIWRLLGRGEAAKPLLSADDPHHHGDGDDCASSVRLFGNPIGEVPIRFVDADVAQVSDEVILKSLPPTPVRSQGRLGPYTWEQNMLLVGEGDFSFSRSLAVASGDPSNMISTSLDSFDDDEEEANSTAAGNHFGNPIGEVPIRLVDADVAQVRDEVILKSLPPAPVRRLGPYSWEQKILLVGEGDFSFSRSLAVAFGDTSNMISTSLDSFEFLMKNYKRALANILELTSKGCKVMHGVDATKMAKYCQLRSLKFDCIVYNFPHAGFDDRQAPRDAQISKQQELVRGFLANAKRMIKGDGQIHITHKCVGFWREWNLEMLGTTEGLRLVEEAPFNHREYPGYKPKYGFGGDGSFNCWPSKRYKFQLVASPNKKRARRKRKN